jgi:multiple sugar transport system permease protein
VFPIVSIVTPLFNLWRAIGLYDTWLGLIIPYLSLTLPISIWTLAAFFRQIPWELEQAAQVDGATPFEAFRKTVVPLAAPGVFTTAIIAFFIAWNDFVYGISLTSTDAARPVPAALSFFTGASQFEEPTGAISAAAIVVTIPIVIVVVIFQRRIVSRAPSRARGEIPWHPSLSTASSRRTTTASPRSRASISTSPTASSSSSSAPRGAASRRCCG